MTTKPTTMKIESFIAEQGWSVLADVQGTQRKTEMKPEIERAMRDAGADVADAFDATLGQGEYEALFSRVTA